MCDSTVLTILRSALMMDEVVNKYYICVDIHLKKF